MTTLQVIGGGKMGEALVGGLIASGWADAGDLAVVEPIAARRDELAAEHPGVDIRDTPLKGVDTLLAVKPGLVAEVCEGLEAPRVISIAAGVRIATIEAKLPEAAVIRVMPNTPALVGEGAAAIAGGSVATEDDLAWARSILESVGTVAVVDEADLDAVTGLSGSGPAYVFLLAEALIAAGEEQGLDRSVATALTEQTLLGAATLLRDSDDDAATLRANVTSPNGTTAAGLAVFDAAGFRGLVADVVKAATDRSKELGGG